MTVRNDDEGPDQIEHDPRWEVPPEPDQGDDSGNSVSVALIAAVTMAVVVALLAWLVMEPPPGI